MTDYVISYSEIELVLRAACSSADKLLKIALENLPHRVVNGNSKKSHADLIVDKIDQRWRIKDNKTQAQYQTNTEADLIYQLTDRVMFFIADQTYDAHCLHAAAVAKNGRAIVLPGNSGDGKSTFTAWLVAHGFDYISDELIFIRRSGEVTGVPRPIQIKQIGLSAILPFIEHPEEVLSGQQTHTVPLKAIYSSKFNSTAMSVSKLAVFLFPKYRHTTDLQWQSMRSAQCGLRVMSNHVNARNLPNYGFKAMMSIVRETPSFSLEYGGFDRLPRDFLSQLNAMLKHE